MEANQKASLTKGRRLLCLYHGEPRQWYERLLLMPVGGSGFVWALLSPEGVVTVEDLRRVEGVRVVPVGGGRAQHTV